MSPPAVKSGGSDYISPFERTGTEDDTLGGEEEEEREERPLSSLIKNRVLEGKAGEMRLEGGMKRSSSLLLKCGNGPLKNLYLSTTGRKGIQRRGGLMECKDERKRKEVYIIKDGRN